MADAAAQPITAEVEGLGTLQFPAGTDPKVVQETVKRQIAQAKAPKVDTQSGLPFTDRAILSSADTAEEKRFYLEKVYGKDNVKVLPVPRMGPASPMASDKAHHGLPKMVARSSDTLAVKVNGKWVDAEGGGLMSGLGADLVAHSPELTMAAAGAIEGSAAGPVGTVAGAGLGAMAGKTIEEGIKALAGNYHKTPGQYAAAVTESGVGMMEAEAGGRIINAAVGKVARGGLPKAITGTTDEAKATFTRLKAEGARPPIASVAPDLRKAQRMTILAEKISGQATGQNKANQAVAEKLARRVLVAGGMDANSAEKAVTEMAEGHGAIDTSKVGDAVRTRVQAHTEMLTRQADTAMNGATAYVDKQAAHFDALIKQHPPGSLGVDVGQGLAGARRTFGTAAEKVYSRVDDMLGGKPVVSAAPIQQAGARLVQLAKGVAQTPMAGQAARLAKPQSDEAATKALFDGLGIQMPPSGGLMTLAQAQRMRTILGEKAAALDLTPGVTKHEIGQLHDAMDRAISQVSLDPQNAPAIKLLKAADKWYSANIKKSNDVQINQLVSRVKETGFTADPADVARLVVKNGESARAEEIKKLVGPDVWKRVASQDMANLLNDARDTMTGQVDGASLAGAIRERGGVMASVHGAQESSRLMNFARNLAATQGKLPSNALSEPALKALMSEYEGAQKDLEEFVKKDPIAALANSKGRPEEIYSVLTKPENGALLEKAVKFLGPKSKEVQGLRIVALQKLLFDSMYEVKQIGPGKAYVKANVGSVLDQYTKAQRELLFPNDLVPHLQQFAKDLHFLFPKPTDQAMAGMSAGSILDEPAIRLGIPRIFGGKGLVAGRWLMQTEASLGRFIINHPGVEEWLAVGRQRGKNAARNDAARLNLVRFYAAQASNGVYDEDEE